MHQFSEIVLRRYIKSDIQLLEKEAQVILEIDKVGRVVHQKFNKNGTIYVIAVLGAGMVKEQNLFFEKASLLEIGFLRGRPYHDVYVSTSKIRLRDRSKRFFLTQNQYIGLRPALFELIKEMTRKKINSWLLKEWRLINHKTKFLRSKRKFVDRSELVSVPVGVRYSVSKKDEEIFWDVCQMDLNNKFIKRKLERMATYFNMIFDRCGTKGDGYRKEKCSEKFLNWMKQSNSGIGHVIEVLQENKLRLHQYQFIYELVERKALFLSLASHAKGISEKEFYQQLCITKQVLKKNNFDSAGCMSKLLIRAIPEKMVKRDFLVFEVSIPDMIDADSLSDDPF